MTELDKKLADIAKSPLKELKVAVDRDLLGQFVEKFPDQRAAIEVLMRHALASLGDSKSDVASSDPAEPFEHICAVCRDTKIGSPRKLGVKGRPPFVCDDCWNEKGKDGVHKALQERKSS